MHKQVVVTRRRCYCNAFQFLTSTKMNNTSYTSPIPCTQNVLGHFAITLLFLALPFHFLVGKILAFNLRFEYPRHIILFCLSVSDSLQVSVTAFALITSTIGDIQTETQSCAGLRYAIQFIVSLTLIVSSLTLVALSIERYIACFHSYRIHELLTNKRIISTLVSFWICGVIGGGIACIPSSQRTSNPLSDSAYFNLIFVCITLPVSLILIVIQSLLLHLSRQKMRISTNAMHPSSSTSDADEEERARKRQIKVAIIASSVVLSYLVCMLPSACMIVVYRFAKPATPRYWKLIFTISLAMANTLPNPFIYGFGMLDTREAIVKELKKIKNYLLIKLCLKDELET